MSGHAEFSTCGRVQGQHRGGSRVKWQEENEVESYGWAYRSIKPASNAQFLSASSTSYHKTLLKLKQEHNGPRYIILMCMFSRQTFLHSSRVPGWWLTHIRYHAASPASAANQVANRTCPVGCRRTAIASWPTYAVPPDAAATEEGKTQM